MKPQWSITVGGGVTPIPATGVSRYKDNGRRHVTVQVKRRFLTLSWGPDETSKRNQVKRRTKIYKELISNLLDATDGGPVPNVMVITSESLFSTWTSLAKHTDSHLTVMKDSEVMPEHIPADSAVLFDAACVPGGVLRAATLRNQYVLYSIHGRVFWRKPRPHEQPLLDTYAAQRRQWDVLSQIG